MTAIDPGQRSRWTVADAEPTLIDQPGSTPGWSISWTRALPGGSGAAIRSIWQPLDWSIGEDTPRDPDNRWDVRRHVEYVTFTDLTDIGATETWRARLSEYPFDLGPRAQRQAQLWAHNGAWRDLRDPARFVPCFDWNGRDPIADLR